METKRLNELLVMFYNDIKDYSDEGREFPLLWNIMHMFSSMQLAKIFAIRRGIDPELSAITALLHDIAVIETKKSKDHAKRAEEFVHRFFVKYNDSVSDESAIISKDEEDSITRAIIQHSDKNSNSHDPLVELIKDVDSLDRYLHGVETEGAYLERCKKMFKEIGIDKLPE